MSAQGCPNAAEEAGRGGTGGEGPPHRDGYPFCTPGGFCKPEKGRLWEFLGRREGSESTEKVNSGLRSQVGPRGL